jgi:hypothetical protein
VVQVLLPVEVILTLFADTAPVESTEPVATTQSPTASARAVVVCVSEALVEELTEMSRVELGAVVEVEDPDGRAKPVEDVPSITSELPVTDVTFPVAKVKSETPEPDPDGRVPDGALPEGGPLSLEVPPDPPGPPNWPREAGDPVLQLPSLGSLTVIEVASIVPDDFVPVTVTHFPAAIDEVFTVSVVVNAVLPVQLTVA